MKVYLSVGIGDMMCVDSIMSQKQRDSITEIYWGCRFGKDIAPLIDNNIFYNVTKHHFIEDNTGMVNMRKTFDYNPNKDSFWHYRYDIEPDFTIGKQLLGITPSDNVTPIYTIQMLRNPRLTYQGSSFLMSSKITDIEWDKLGVEPQHYILMHYPTSTRPRSDIATIIEKDWAFTNRLSKEKNLKVIVLSDKRIQPPLDNFILLEKPPITSIIALSKYAGYYVGCDSFCAILSCKVLAHDRLHIKTHDRRIYNKLPTHTWLKKFFLPHDYIAIQQFYRPEL